jgi:uncharacterized protein
MGQVNGDLANFEAAAEAGDAGALYDLGLSYSTGRNGAPNDYVVAHKWFNLATLRGYEPARVERAEVAELMSDKEIAEAQRLAREWVSTH